MIKYDMFWITLEKKGITQYNLINEYNISKSLLHRLRHNQGVSTSTLNILCNILDCKIEDIITHHKD